MRLTAKQVRLAAQIAEFQSDDDAVVIDHEDKRGIAPSVDMAIQVHEGIHGRRPDGWKIYVVEPSGRATLRSDYDGD